MKVVVAIDSLKGSLTSLEAGEAIREGILRAMPEAEVVVRPLADGGEGTVEALTYGMGGMMEHVTVTGPLGKPVECAYGRVPSENLAIVEMSGAAGITLVPEAERDPMNTTTYGVGEVIRHAIAKGCRTFIVGIGGSATNDGGIGMLQALGFGLLNEAGTQVSFGAKGLQELRSITTDHVVPELKDCTFRIACDVTNPLCGSNGASAIYGPQKGATPAAILQMDKWLGDYAVLAKETFPEADAVIPGTGAAGGLGFAFLTFLGGKLNSGTRIVLDETHLEDYVKDADIVITGEGRLDAERRGKDRKAPRQDRDRLFRQRDGGRHRLQRQGHRRVLPDSAQRRDAAGRHGPRQRRTQHGKHRGAGLPPDPCLPKVTEE